MSEPRCQTCRWFEIRCCASHDGACDCPGACHFNAGPGLPVAYNGWCSWHAEREPEPVPAGELTEVLVYPDKDANWSARFKGAVMSYRGMTRCSALGYLMDENASVFNVTITGPQEWQVP